jgi:tetratricopeptide (TPR) repeat protein
MITTRQMHVEIELIKWLVLFLVATALVLAIATTAAAAEPMLEPERLPADMALLAKPMPAELPARPHFPEDRPPADLAPVEIAAKLWTVLENHRAGCTREALAGWDDIRLEAGAEAWREVARGAAFLAAGDLDRAEQMLREAQQIEPAQPVAAYFMGVLHLERAAAAMRAPDRAVPGQTQFVAYVPNAAQELRGTQQLLARQQLELAVANAHTLQLDERLVVGPGGMEEVVVVPRVGDLLVALGADKFVPQAHQLLFGLALDRGELDEAETQLDRAVGLGMTPLYGYEDLAQAYLAQGRETDAARMAQKDIRANYPELWKAGEETRAALDRLWNAWDW